MQTQKQQNNTATALLILLVYATTSTLFATCWKNSISTKKGEQVFAYLKGAPDFCIPRCSRVMTSEGEIQDITDAHIKLIQDGISNFAVRSLRTMLIAFKPVSESKMTEDVDQIEQNMVFIALVGIQDPLRPEAIEAVKKCAHAGVIVRMVTGDFVETARAIAKECGIISTDIAVDAEGTGVLFNLEGEVIGLITPSVWDKEDYPVANARAISDLKTVIEILANDENVPYVGIYATTVTSDLQEQGMPAGIYVVDVDPESPAMEAGIQSGDIICEAAHEEITGINTYQNTILKTKAGDVIRVAGQRRGADGYVDIDFTITVGSKK